ncbi:PREDICTED: uncharacterized protein C16C10.8 [Nicrophorus vespilloides]|uniref:Uncharacterized protein C16C10.8 n=1 Tax=Nicrophorus vespilloides TaxID=110193 RepID=A0ABM1MWV5_NICVS|nr:PREDICTED: uncharacterized protein C16C10.8 [Nicrophorus vespilloides]
MVVFTCNNCGESLQKPKVEKHYQFSCKRGKNLTCVDCHKDFLGDAYGEHIRCVSEADRYSAKGSSIKQSEIPKGEQKQQEWMDMIRNSIDNDTKLSKDLRNVLDKILVNNNLPMKQKPFMNFVFSSLGGRVPKHNIEAAWNVIDNYKKKWLEQKSEATKRKAEEAAKSEATSKKAKIEPEVVENGKSEEAPEENGVSEGGKFSFETQIFKELKGKENMSVAKLRKAVLKAYLKQSGKEEKFNKKLESLDTVEIKDGIVTLK